MRDRNPITYQSPEWHSTSVSILWGVVVGVSVLVADLGVEVLWKQSDTTYTSGRDDFNSSTPLQFNRGLKEMSTVDRDGQSSLDSRGRCNSFVLNTSKWEVSFLMSLSNVGNTVTLKQDKVCIHLVQMHTLGSPQYSAAAVSNNKDIAPNKMISKAIAMWVCVCSSMV